MVNRRALLGSSSPLTFPHRSDWSLSPLPVQGWGEATPAWQSHGSHPGSVPEAVLPSLGLASSEPQAWTSIWAPEPKCCWSSLVRCPPQVHARKPVGWREDGIEITFLLLSNLRGLVWSLKPSHMTHFTWKCQELLSTSVVSILKNIDEACFSEQQCVYWKTLRILF